MSLPAASLSTFFASSLRLLDCNLWRGVGEDVEMWDKEAGVLPKMEAQGSRKGMGARFLVSGR